jgi:hypothetical protein
MALGAIITGAAFFLCLGCSGVFLGPFEAYTETDCQ